MIIFMGVAGAGKSVQGTLLAEYLGYQWLSTGEYLRANIGEERKADMLKGKLLGDEEIIDILRDFFAEIEDSHKCILDGFPRTLPQAEWLLEQHRSGVFDIDKVLYMKAAKEIVIDRLAHRGRADDTPEAISKRFEEFNSLTLPVIEHFIKSGIRVIEVDAEGEVDDIQQDIRAKIAG